MPAQSKDAAVSAEESAARAKALMKTVGPAVFLNVLSGTASRHRHTVDTSDHAARAHIVLLVKVPCSSPPALPTRGR